MSRDPESGTVLSVYRSLQLEKPDPMSLSFQGTCLYSIKSSRSQSNYKMISLSEAAENKPLEPRQPKEAMVLIAGEDGNFALYDSLHGYISSQIKIDSKTLKFNVGDDMLLVISDQDSQAYQMIDGSLFEFQHSPSSAESQGGHRLQLNKIVVPEQDDKKHSPKYAVSLFKLTDVFTRLFTLQLNFLPTHIAVSTSMIALYQKLTQN